VQGFPSLHDTGSVSQVPAAQLPSCSHGSSREHAAPSSTAFSVHPSPGTQGVFMHGPASPHTTGSWSVHAPALQLPASRQGSPEAHGTPSSSVVNTHPPCDGAQLSWVQGLRSSQGVGLPLPQLRSVQNSPLVQGSPSSQGPFTGAWPHEPSSAQTSWVQASASSHAGATAMHDPCWQAPGVSQTPSAEQSVPSSTGSVSQSPVAGWQAE
jgi:hypothetical protein